MDDYIYNLSRDLNISAFGIPPDLIAFRTRTPDVEPTNMIWDPSLQEYKMRTYKKKGHEKQRKMYWRRYSRRGAK